MNPEITLRPATDGDLFYVFMALRPGDKHEVAQCGDTLIRLSSPETVVVDGTPAALRGVHLEGGYAWLFFVGTAVVDDYPVQMHKMAREFVAAQAAAYPDRVLAAQVWDGYAKSIRWLERLGFTASGKYATDGIMVMEKR